MFKTLSAKYYQKNKERLQMKVGERYQGLPENEKNKILDFGHERQKNLSEVEKQRLLEYRKKYYKIWKNKNAS